MSPSVNLAYLLLVSEMTIQLRIQLKLEFNWFSFSCTLKIHMEGWRKFWGRFWSERNPPSVQYCLFCSAINSLSPKKRKEAADPLWCNWQLRFGNEVEFALMGTPPVWIHPWREAVVPLNATIWIQNILLSNY